MSKIWFLNDDSFYDSKKIFCESFYDEFQDDLKIINIKDVVCCISNERGLHITYKKGEIINPPKIVY